MVNIEQVEQILSKSIEVGLWDGEYVEIFREGRKVIEVSPSLEFPKMASLTLVRLRHLDSGRLEVSKFKSDGRPIKELIRHLDIDGFRDMKHVTGKIHYLGGWNALWNVDFWYPDCQWSIPVGCSQGDISAF